LSRDTLNKFKKDKLSKVGLQQIEFVEGNVRFEKGFSFRTKRVQAIIKTLKNNGRVVCRKYKITKSLQKRASCWGLELDKMGIMYANYTQHGIYQEAMTLLNESAQKTNNFSDIVGNSAMAAHEYGQGHEYVYSYRLLDFARVFKGYNPTNSSCKKINYSSY
jgi:hypothetical protein